MATLKLYCEGELRHEVKANLYHTLHTFQRKKYLKGRIAWAKKVYIEKNSFIGNWEIFLDLKSKKV